MSLYDDNVNPLNKPTALVALLPTVNPFKTLKFVQPSKKLSKDAVFMDRLFIDVNVLQLANLTDLAPNNKLDLTPSSESWDPNKWVTEVQNTKQQLYNLGIQLQLAQATYDEFFKV